MFGELRTRFDAAKCEDLFVYERVSAFRLQVCRNVLQQISKQSVTTLETIVNKVIQTDENIGYNYNPYWINLCGLQASLARPQGEILDENDLSIPIEEWSQIAQETRVKFHEMFQDLIKEIDK